MPLTNEQERELRDLIASGQKIVAVKRFREITGVGLREAMYAVTQISGGDAGEAKAQNTALPGAKATQQAEAEALRAIREGNIIEAIKRYRIHTKLGLKESKDAVDALSVVHSSGGRINAKLARALIGMVTAGKKQEAITHLMTNVGYDDAEARAFIGTLAARSGGCAGGCLRLIVGLGLLIALWIGLRQYGYLP